MLLDTNKSCLSCFFLNTQAVVQQALSRLMAGRTVLVIAHRLSTIRDADRICVISGGQLAEQGSHEELISNKGLYAGLIARQLEGGSPGSSDGIGASQTALSIGSFSSRAAGGSMSDLSEGARPGLQEVGRSSMSSSRGSTSQERSSVEAQEGLDAAGSSSTYPQAAAGDSRSQQ
jgi:ABC-type multidrug transport system ATPase subunit